MISTMHSGSSMGVENPMATFWEGSYKPVDPRDHLCRRWQPSGDVESSISIIQLLPDAQKPHLPEGHIWFQDKKDLAILRHKDAPVSDFKIYIFGPDKRRIQYLVEQDVAGKKVATHGFAIARKEGFPKALRDEYPVTSESFKHGDTTYWRGHILDYDDTLGTPDERETISTLFALNYKPEPQVCWARTLRTKAIASARDVDGAYGELMLYGFLPTKTNSGKPIPEAIFLELFNYPGESTNRYYVPKEHECHGWSSQKGEKNFAIKSLKKLEQEDRFPALVFNKKQPIIERDRRALPPINLEQLDEKEAYHLARDAEMEYESAELKLGYAVYGKYHNAPLKTMKFWLTRAAETALNVDSVYRSSRPPFSVWLLDSFKDLDRDLTPYIDQLKKIADRVMKVCSRLDLLPLKQEPTDEESTNGSISLTRLTGENFLRPHSGAPSAVQASAPSATVSIILPVQPSQAAAPVVDSPPTEVECNCDTQNPGKLGGLIKKVTEAVQQRSPLILTKVRSVVANNIFPTIAQEAKQISPEYKPVQSIEISNPCWKGAVSKLATTLFGPQVVITVIPASLKK